MAGQVAHMEKKNTYKILGAVPEATRSLGRSRSRWENSIKWITWKWHVRLWSGFMMRTALFWTIMQRVVVIPHWLFGTKYQSHLQGPKIREVDSRCSRRGSVVGCCVHCNWTSRHHEGEQKLLHRRAATVVWREILYHSFEFSIAACSGLECHYG